MLNQIALIGRLTKDPEIKLVGKDQNSVVRFILAVNRPKYGDSKPQADFIPVVAWRGTADFIGRNFRKGKQVYVSGRLQTTEWEKDGVKRYGFEIVARDVGFADSVSKQDGQTSTAPRSTKNEPQSMPDVFSDDDFNNAGGFDDNFGGFGNDQEWPV